MRNPHNKPGRGGEEQELLQRQGDRWRKAIEAACERVLAQEWGPERPTVVNAMEALKRELGL